ncbi:DUF6443 domain-containing protein [Aquimarina spongiae]|uniref:RHS repeat-associated core domain-containing protein n=1 Tax=Aquimarina spongiae TaxID=570521 RepID=A0A1M6BGX7_9FLAO|nr:DUF6443 domain-containing protein [Aquimarina spongiae]SHI47971.1 RHS repeat-associated core domain-containing protein [Aquimarina spongiae]
MIQHISKYILVALLFVVVTLQGQTQTNIVKDGNYTVTGSETLTATQSITLKPNSWIKSGSTFSAIVSADAYIDVAFDSNENYVFTRAYQRAMSSSTGISNNSDVIESITYFDGLGRPKQQIGIKATPDKGDLVNHIGYDQYGRQAKQYLPFEAIGNAGEYTAVDINTNINSFYKNKYPEDFTGVSTANVNAYSESIFEDSPLSRVLEQGAPGKDWKANPNSDADHTIKFDWQTNTANEVFYFWVNFHMDNTEVPILVKDGYYGANELLVTTTKDENWQPNQQHPNDHTVKEYKDKLGRVILKRTYNNNVAHDTYYVHDDFGNLTYVIPPKVTLSATDGVSATELSELCYQYIYDYRNRMVEKKIPGKDREYVIYNKLDQPVMTQDGLQRPKKEWLFTKYDAFGRVAYTGLHEHSFVTTRAGLQQNAFNNSNLVQYETKQSSASSIAGTTIYYSDNAYPDTKLIYTINYYDNYTFDHNVSNPGTVMGQTVNTNVEGLATGTKVRVLGTNDWITTVTYYDAKGRPIYVHSTNTYLNTVDIVETKLDFAGKILETKTTHTKDSNVAIVTVDTFSYDHMGRLLTQNQTINNQAEEQIVSNTYDELGQLENKDVGGGLQAVVYAYNIRGWLTGINDVNTLGNKLFSFKINYNQIEGLHNVDKLYNGNIAQTIWKTANDNTKRSYAYEFDALNRITRANSNKGNTLMTGDSFSIWGIAYDKNGNIGRITRNGNPTGAATQKIDELYYTYSNNKLTDVREAVTSSYKNEGFKDGTNANDDFEYDINGNTIIDRNKNISSITYNHLNLPTQVSFTNNSGFFPTLLGSIRYTYDALGNKLSKKVSENGATITTDYAGNYVYKSNTGPGGCAGCPSSASGPDLQFFNHAEGYSEPQNDGGFAYIYQYKDHLGNIRLSFGDQDNNGTINPSNEILEEKNYYPFGLTHKGYNNIQIGTKNNFKQFQGQEFTEDLGINVHEWKYRVSDPTIGRFWQIDPLAEKYNWMTTYQFSSNQPIHAPELEGMESSHDLNTRDVALEGATKEERKAVLKHQTTAFVTGAAVSADLYFTRGTFSKNLIEQAGIQFSFNLADQMIKGEEVNLTKAIGDATRSADLGDAGIEIGLSKLVPGSTLATNIVNKVSSSMVDITLEGGFQLGGVNKEVSDVATDFTFSVITDRIKSTELPNTKFSGNNLVKSLKDSLIDFASSESQKTSVSKTKISTSQSTDEREINTKKIDNTRVRF